MPTFINGPAGSGKSTLLQYLFAHYWLSKARTEKAEGEEWFKGRPLYLTLNKDLLRTAKSSVASILSLDPDNLEREEEDVLNEISGSFISFRDLLGEIIGKEDCERMFPARLEINFEIFRNLLVGRSEQIPGVFSKMGYQRRIPRNITPELCWHVIRSYVKGFDLSYYMSADDFRGLAGRKDDAFVSEDDFDCIVSEVWPWYKKWTVDVNRRADAPEERFWDQQDLARAALSFLGKNRNELPRNLQEITAVFCDEAQDLTGVELRIVQRISILSEYDLKYAATSPSLPFAFAADPMQTLNPSGFRWQNLKASLYQNLIQPLGVRSAGNAMKDTQTLTLNYRSPREITFFSNLIQLARKCLFSGEAKAQAPHKSEEGTPAFRWFEKDAQHPLSDGELASLAGSVIVLPCSEGWEEDTIKKFPVLRQIQERDKNQVFLSVMSAKGQTFKNVVVFGFGHELFADKPVPETTDGSCRDISLSYAMNKLYVAISRSASRLLVLDSFEGKNNLWDRIGTDDYKNKCLEALRNSPSATVRDEVPRWEENLPSEVSTWKHDDFSRVHIFASLNPQELAYQGSVLEREARAQRSIPLMNQAGNFYAQAGKPDNKTWCDAFVAEYQGNYKKAAELFDSIPFDSISGGVGSEEGTRCLWEGGCWDLVKDRGYASDKQKSIARFLCSPPTNSTVVTFLQSSAEFRKPSPETSEAFRQVASLLGEWCQSTLLKKEWDNETRHAAMAVADYLEEFDYWFPDLHVLLFRLSVRLAEQIGTDNWWEKAQKYFRSESEPGAERDWISYRAHRGVGAEFVNACMKLDDFELFLRRKDDSRSMFVPGRLDKTMTGWIFDGLRKKQGNEAALRFALSSGDFSQAEKVLEGVPFPVLLQLAKALAGRTTPDWNISKSIFGTLILQATADELAQLEEVFLSSPRVRPLGNEIANAVFSRVETLASNDLWPTSDDDVLRAGKLFETLSNQEHLAKLSGLVIQKLKANRNSADNQAIQEMAVRCFLRSSRMGIAASGRSGSPSMDIQRKVEQQILNWGIRYNPQDWDRAARPLPEPGVLPQPALQEKPSKESLTKAAQEAIARGDITKAQEILAQIQGIST